MEGVRVLIVGGDDAGRAAVVDCLAAAGFVHLQPSPALPSAGTSKAPGLIVATGDDVAIICAEARGRPDLIDVPVLAVVAPLPAHAAGEVLAAGADDVLVTPLQPAVAGNRARRAAMAADERRRAREAATLESTLLEVQEIMSSRGDSPEGIRDALLACRDMLGFDRASLIAHIEGSDQAFVIAATDDPTLSKFRLHIELYPEISEAIQRREPILIDDAQDHPLTSPVRPALAKKGIHGVAAFPAVWHGRALGALLLRRAAPGVGHLTGSRLAAAQLIAGDVAAHLADGKVMANLREQTHRISRARYEAERRLRAIDTVKAYFDASSDGVVVLDAQGNILFVNRSAESITGYARSGLLGTPLAELVAARQRESLREVIRRVLRGHNLDAFDLELSTTAGTEAIVSVATSTVLASNDAVILMFRDVTAERQLEHELTKTKDFLERLIGSTVDAIIAADVKGNIILFNPGAERIYGYAADEVIGRLPVWRLYPDGVAQQVMRMLRSPSYGGVGRLEQTRREILTQQGELVPVNMTASIIYEDGREVATVGIFSDLRERIKIEQRLLAAQEKLMVSEKQALVAELAGAAAHELNQPLTSILGYVELILRKLPDDDPHARYVRTIQTEGERMAEIVKKIGRITRYETKEYVGSASILDLDKSSGHSVPEEDPQ